MHGVHHAAWVPRDFEPLCALQLAPHMLSDHKGALGPKRAETFRTPETSDPRAGIAYLRALKAVKEGRRAPETPPAWVPFDGAPDGCACCQSHFTWESTLRSSAQQICARHHCRGCGRAVCDPCSKHRTCLPQVVSLHL